MKENIFQLIYCKNTRDAFYGALICCCSTSEVREAFYNVALHPFIQTLMAEVVMPVVNQLLGNKKGLPWLLWPSSFQVKQLN